MQNLFLKVRSFVRNEDGIATAWALGWLVLCFSIAGLSIDVTNAWKVQQILQSTADVSAHAGGLALGNVGNEGIQQAVEDRANQIATANMTPTKYGDVLVDNDIYVGYWDPDNKVFTEMTPGDIDIPNAVRAITRQDGGASARVGTFFLRFVGFDAFTINALATVESFVSICERDGLIARGKTRMSTQQLFKGKFCVYGLDGVNASDQNTFEDETYVGMIDLADCGPLPENCTNESNPGIEDALQQQVMTFGKIDRIDETIAKLQDPYSDIMPDYITNMTVNTTYLSDTRSFDAFTDLVEGAVNVIQCRPNENISLGNLLNLTNSGGNNTDTGTDAVTQSEILSKLVIVGIGCNFNFDATIAYEDAYIATTSTGQQTFGTSADARLGKKDDCAEDGEVTLISAGSVNFAAKLDAYDLEVIAASDVNLASHANDAESIHKGTNIWAGGDISVTTKHTFEPCGLGGDTDLEQKFTLRYVE